jgi:hypothetical protein
MSGMFAWLKSILPRSVRRAVSLYLHRDDLTWLAAYFGTDKWGGHRYARHYVTHLGHLRTRRFNLLEIGVGGFEDPHAGAGSLRMWKAYFPHARIYGLDLFDKSSLQEDRITIFQGSQADPAFLRALVDRIGRIDVVIDDGSHVNAHVVTSVETLFPLLPDGAIYIIEDLQTAYWPLFGGSSDPHADNTSIAWLKARVDGLNWEEVEERAVNPLDRTIASVHLYHNLAFLYKGQNVEGSTRAQVHIVYN